MLSVILQCAAIRKVSVQTLNICTDISTRLPAYCSTLMKFFDQDAAYSLSLLEKKSSDTHRSKLLHGMEVETKGHNIQELRQF